LKRFFTFTAVAWLLGGAAIFFLLAVPPLQGAWAHLYWERVPCKVNMNEGKFRNFVYQYKGAAYNSGRQDFWVRKNTQSTIAAMVMDPKSFDQTCYVNPNEPLYAVWRIDAHRQWDRAAESLFLAAFVTCVAIGLTFVSNARRKAKTA
jgi:hypothetical protein